MTAKEQKLGYDSGSVSTLDKVKRFASRNGALIGLIILCIISVSYTHLTLPTKRIV